MNDANVVTLEQVRGFLAGTVDVGFMPAADPVARYSVIKQVLKRFNYPWQGQPTGA